VSSLKTLTSFILQKRLPARIKPSELAARNLSARLPGTDGACFRICRNSLFEEPIACNNQRKEQRLFVLDYEPRIGGHMNGPLQWVLFGFLLGPLLGFAQGPRLIVEILEAETAEHRIGDRGPIYTNLGHEHFASACEVVVGADGKAVSAQMSGGFFSDLTLLCKTWRYKPFERNGEPVAARVRETLAILPIGERPETHVPFPEIQDWNSLRITISRSGCYGMCSTYEIEIHGDGTVLYHGQAFVGTTGKRKVQISHASLVKLVDAFRRADYFSLSTGYVSGVTDSPTYVSSISFDGLSKSVLNYVGRDAGMPPGVSDVEAAIDRLSGASKWITRK
jgi:hypothetical protein